jgi:hypothetical protein
VTFTDPQATGANIVAAYASRTEASLGQGLPSLGTPPIVIDRYVLELAPGALQARPLFVDAISKVVASYSPREATTTTAPSSTGREHS